MKKISLKDVKNGLKRDEMRMILGGGCGQGCIEACKSCSVNSDCCSTVCAQDQPGCGGGKRCLK